LAEDDAGMTSRIGLIEKVENYAEPARTDRRLAPQQRDAGPHDRGLDDLLTVYIANKVRTGLTPAVNALGLILITLTIIAAVAYEIVRRREAKKAEIARELEHAATPMRALRLRPASAGTPTRVTVVGGATVAAR